MQVIIELLLVIGLATLASTAVVPDTDPIVAGIKASELDLNFLRKFQGILRKSMNNAVNHIRELRPANHTVFYKQPNGNIQVPVVAAFGAINVTGLNNLEAYWDVSLLRTMKRNLCLEFVLKGQPLKFEAHVTVSSMETGAQFDILGKISFSRFYGVIYHKYSPKQSNIIEEALLDEPDMNLDAFVPSWLNKTTFISESVKQLLPFTKTYIVNEFSKHVLLNLNYEEVEDTLNKYRNSD